MKKEKLTTVVVRVSKEKKEEIIKATAKQNICEVMEQPTIEEYLSKLFCTGSD